MTERDRIVQMLHGERMDLLPWATRLDIWHTSRLRTGTLPAEMCCMDRREIHHYVKIGWQSYATLVTTRLCGVEMTIEFNGEVIHQEASPTLRFPRPLNLVYSERPGETVFTFETPVGRARLRYRMIDELIQGAASPYLVEHILKDDDDLGVVKWILGHAEIEQSYGDFEASEAAIGDQGFTIGFIDRVPFQRLLLDFMGEEHMVYEMVDNPKGFQYLLDLLSEQGREMLDISLASPATMVEFGDNFDGAITSPRLFQEHCIPFLQDAADKIHAQGRFLGSHMDGNMKPLLHLIPECGIDVVESFSPAPLTRLTFEEAWQTWRGKVLIWGGIPSSIFESHVPEDKFIEWVKRMLAHIGDDGQVILGVGDQALGPTLIERVRRVSEMVGRQSGAEREILET